MIHATYKHTPEKEDLTLQYRSPPRFQHGQLQNVKHMGEGGSGHVDLAQTSTMKQVSTGASGIGYRELD